ncbi:hypothetical protein [Brucella intermedia]|uniref:hypothetical protein n=1 Tax=Brucella intermedia TaxID=94625 RepID=UPI00235DFA4B|nr:hypothetical protein [Brucella intermedia]
MCLVPNAIPGRIFTSLAVVLSLDQVFFFVGLNLLSGVPVSAFYGGWIGAAGFFSMMLTLFLRIIDTSVISPRGHAVVNILYRLTYRHRYEKLVGRIGRDAFTGLTDRGQVNAKGPAMLKGPRDRSFR